MEKFLPSHEFLDSHRVRNLINAIILQSSVLVKKKGRPHITENISRQVICKSFACGFVQLGLGAWGGFFCVCVCARVCMSPVLPWPLAHCHLGKWNLVFDLPRSKPPDCKVGLGEFSDIAVWLGLHFFGLYSRFSILKQWKFYMHTLSIFMSFVAYGVLVLFIICIYVCVCVRNFLISSMEN